MRGRTRNCRPVNDSACWRCCYFRARNLAPGSANLQAEEEGVRRQTDRLAGYLSCLLCPGQVITSNPLRDLAHTSQPQHICPQLTK